MYTLAYGINSHFHVTVLKLVPVGYTLIINMHFIYSAPREEKKIVTD